MDDQTNQAAGTPNVLGSAPSMGDVATPAPAPDAVAAPTAVPTLDPTPAPVIPSMEEKADDPVVAALKRIEDKVNAIAIKVGA